MEIILDHRREAWHTPTTHGPQDSGADVGSWWLSQASAGAMNGEFAIVENPLEVTKELVGSVNEMNDHWGENCRVLGDRFKNIPPVRYPTSPKIPWFGRPVIDSSQRLCAKIIIAFSCHPCLLFHRGIIKGPVSRVRMSIFHST